MAGTLVPTFTFGPTGFVAPSGPAVLAGVQGDINAAFGNNLNYQLTTPQGQLASSEAAVISNTYATFQYYTQQVDPAYASGRMQDAIGRIYFLERDAAEPTTLQVSCSGQAATIPAGALLKDQSGNTYAATVDGVLPAGGGAITLQFNCTVPGPVPVPSSVSIYQAINGWDSATVASGVVGRDVESRAAFEARRRDSVAGNSFGPITAILGAIAKVPNVLDFYGYNNNTNAPVTVRGVVIPAYAIYVSVAGGVAADVAAAILTKKGAGAPMAGNTTVTVYDTNPLYASPPAYQITFTIPSPLQLLWSVVLVNSPLIPSDAQTQVQNALIAAATGQSDVVPPPPRARIGSTVYAAQYIGAINELGSWAQVASILVGSKKAPSATFWAQVAGTAMTVIATGLTGALAPGQFLFDSLNVVPNGTQVTVGSGGAGAYSINQPVTLGGSFTGSGSGTNLTVSALSGFLEPGMLVQGTGVPANTTIVSQASGPTGGNGVYVTSNPTTIAGAGNAYAALVTAVAGSASVAVNADEVPQVTAPNIVVGAT